MTKQYLLLINKRNKNEIYVLHRPNHWSKSYVHRNLYLCCILLQHDFSATGISMCGGAWSELSGILFTISTIALSDLLARILNSSVKNKLWGLIVFLYVILGESIGGSLSLSITAISYRSAIFKYEYNRSIRNEKIQANHRRRPRRPNLFHPNYLPLRGLHRNPNPERSLRLHALWLCGDEL